jgi:nucleotide-binding universal stress UspA family protein
LSLLEIHMNFEGAAAMHITSTPAQTADWILKEKTKREVATKATLAQASASLVKQGKVKESQLRVVIVESSDIRDAVSEANYKSVLISRGLQVLNAASANGASSIVLGSSGHSQLQRAFLGSLATYLVNHANCPVVVARGATFSILSLP